MKLSSYCLISPCSVALPSSTNTFIYNKKLKMVSQPGSEMRSRKSYFHEIPAALCMSLCGIARWDSMQALWICTPAILCPSAVERVLRQAGKDKRATQQQAKQANEWRMEKKQNFLSNLKSNQNYFFFCSLGDWTKQSASHMAVFIFTLETVLYGENRS